MSPVARYLPSGMYCFTKKPLFSRVLFLSFSVALLAFSFAWTEVAVRSQRGIWVLRYESFLYPRAGHQTDPSLVSAQGWSTVVSSTLCMYAFPSYALRVLNGFSSPGILSSIWGIRNLGRNFGVLALSPLLGTPPFSLLYSYVAASHTDGGICEGVRCWQLTFWINAGCAVTALGLSLLLWNRWKDRV